MYNWIMNLRKTLLLTLTLILASCGPTPPPPSTEVGAAVEEPTSVPMVVPVNTRPTASPAPTSSRSATFAELENIVEARPAPADEYAPASIGLTLFAGGAARTGDDGRARLDLAPDATILRLAPNTIFTLSELKERDDGPFTILKLFIGNIYIILSGGELQVETPSGLASVRGSMMGVSYDPNTGAMTATCLEGHCSLRTKDRVVELIAGQAADIRDGILVRVPRLITDGELLDWFEFTPELEDLRDRLTTLRDRLDDLPRLPRPRPRRLP